MLIIIVIYVIPEVFYIATKLTVIFSFILFFKQWKQQ